MLEIQGTHGDKAWTVKSNWLAENKIAYIEFIGDFDKDGVLQFNSFWTENYIDKGNAPVHSIIDATQLNDYPKSLSTLREGSNISVNNPNMGWIILVGFSKNPVLKFLSSAVNQLFSVKFKQVDTVEDAKDILRRVDNTLSEIV